MMMVLGDICFMFLEFPSEFYLMMWYDVGVTSRGCSTLASCVGCVMGTCLMVGWVNLFVMSLPLMMLLWWDDSCCLCGIFLGDLTL
jgi:hypothetical protein